MFIRDLLLPSHLLVIFGLVLLFFGSKKLPQFGKGLGDGLREFRNSVKTIRGDRP
jgi:sec-independent protein translocase protein TatA